MLTARCLLMKQGLVRESSPAISWGFDKDFAGGYCWMAQGPMPIEWGMTQTGSRGLGRQALRDEMERHNHSMGLKMVGEMLPDERSRVTLHDDTDQYGLRVARVTHSWGGNDKALIQHALGDRQRAVPETQRS